MSLLTNLKEQCIAALQQAYPKQSTELSCDTIEITEATNPKFGHYQCNSAMKLAKLFKQPPQQIAENIVSHWPLTVCERLDIAGPGFINIWISPQALTQRLTQLLQSNRCAIPLSTLSQKVVIDYSSPNIAKEMHVGHLRSTIIGDALCRILKFLGHEVLSLNHLGDWGTQFGMIIAYLKNNHPNIEQIDFTLSDFVTAYRQAKEKFDQDLDFKQQAQLAVVALQSGDREALQLWKKICQISEQAYQEIYQLLDVHLISRGESFYNPLLNGVIEHLTAKQLLTHSDGADCVYVDGFTNRDGDPLPLIVRKKDGGFNYATTDLAALEHRIVEEKATWLIYITGAEQAQHFAMVFNCAAKADLYNPEKVRIDHIPLGFVLRADGKKFKTRSGETEKLIDLLNTAIDKAKILLQSRDPNLSEAEANEMAAVLGINAIKYADLSTHRSSNYTFSYDRMLQFEGNTAAFVLYAYVRIESIKRKINIDVNQLKNDNAQTISLDNPQEISLAIHLCQFEDTLLFVAKELVPHRLCEYLFRLAEKFHVFFHHCRVEGVPEQSSRLLLCEAVSQVLQQGLRLLGLKTLSKM